MTPSIAILSSKQANNPSKTLIVISATPNIGFHLGDLFRVIISDFDGKGGGKPNRAEGSIPTANLEGFLATFYKALEMLPDT